MSLDLEDVEWEENDFTDTDDGARSGVHNGLAVAFAECAVEASAVVLCQIVPDEGLTTEFVYTLKDLTLSTFALSL